MSKIEERSAPGAIQPRSDCGLSSRWYVVETQRKKEDVAVFNLKRQSFRSICLRFEKTRRHARRTDTILEPLFPGYAFVQFDIDKDSWRSINGTLGVKRLIGSDLTRPQPVPDEAMQTLLQRFGDGAVMSSPDAIKIGDAVRIVSGPFADIFATVESLDEKGRVCVLLDILGRSTTLRLRAETIATVDR